MSDALDARAAHPGYHLSRIAVLTWAEALRDEALRERCGSSSRHAQERFVELAAGWTPLRPEP